MSTAPPYGIGIIGAGDISRLHALAFRGLPGLARLVAVADLDGERAERIRREHGFEVATTDTAEMLARDDVDVVCVCTRPNLHARLAGQAIEAGKHVLCEKPLAHNLPDCDALIEIADAHPDQLLSVVYQWRNDRDFRALRELVDRGDLGRPLMGSMVVRTNRGAAYYADGAARESWSLDGGGALMVIGIHQLDLLTTLFGEVAECSARMDTFTKPTEAEDSMAGWIRFKSGALVTLACSVCDHESNFDVTILGERASARLTGARRGRPPAPQECRLTLHAARRGDRMALQAGRLGEIPRRLSAPILRARAQRTVGRLLRRPFVPPTSWWHGPMAKQFLVALRDGHPAPVGPREARRSVEIAAALYHSARTGAPVSLPLGRGESGYDHLPAASPVRALP